MSDDSPTGAKTEEPTPKKLRDARKKGQVAQSKETSTAVIFIILTGLSFGLIPDMFDELYAALNLVITLSGDLSEGAMGDAISAVVTVVFKILLFPLAITFILVVSAKFMEVGIFFSSEPMKLDFSKLAFKGFSNVFSKKNLFDWFISLIKTICILFVVGSVIYAHIHDIAKASSQCDLSCTLTVWARIAGIALFFVAVLSVLVAGIDIMMQQFFHKKKLMMSQYELKQESKETQGNPEIKGKRKQIHKEILNSPVKQQVAKAAVLVTNPTHVAIGLSYEEGQETLPTVCLKEVEKNALAARRFAYLNNIPIVEDPPLARALLAKSALNEFIPEEFIDPVVVVLKWAQQVKQNEREGVGPK